MRRKPRQPGDEGMQEPARSRRRKWRDKDNGSERRRVGWGEGKVRERTGQSNEGGSRQDRLPVPGLEAHP